MKTNIRPGTLFVGAALVLGAVTAYLLYNYLQQVSKPKPVAKVTVIHARVDIPARQVITEQMVYPLSLPAETTVVVPGAATDMTQVVGKVAIEPIKKLDQIRLPGIAEKGKVPGLSFSIPPGKRAITISINETKGVGGSIFPGDSVDILCSLKDPTRGEQTVQVPLQNMKVLAIDKAKVSSSEGALSSLTLCASPEEAQLITVAEEQGVFRVVLRAQGDTIVADDKAVSLDRFIKRAPKVVEEKEDKSKPAAAPTAAPAAQRKIVIFDGGTTKEFNVKY